MSSKSGTKDQIQLSTVATKVKSNDSERSQAEKELEKTISLLNATLESIADGIVVVDLAGNTLTYNQNFLQMWHMPQELVEPRNTQERLAFITSQVQDSEEFLKRVTDLADRPEAEGYDIVKLKDGRVFERHSKPQWLGDKIVGRVWNFRDITDQQRVEESLRQNEASLAAAQRIAHVGNWDTHVPTNHLTWSDEIYRIFGLAPQEFDATVEAFFSRVHPEDLDYVLKAVGDAMAGRKVYNVDHRIIRSNGEVRFVHQEAEVTFDEAGQPLRMLGIVQDVTERRRLEQQIQELLERRSRQVHLSAQLAQEVATVTNLDTLYQRVVTWINERFGFYHTQILRYYPDTNKLILLADYGETGGQILAKEQYQVGSDKSLIGLAAIAGTPILKSDVSTDPHWRAHPSLPATRGELAVPITLGGEDSQAQAAALQHFIKSDFDGFAVMALDPPAVVPMAHKAIQSGKSVVAIGTDLGEQNQSALVSASEREMGYLLGQQTGKWAKKHARTRKTLKIGMLVYAEPFGQIIEREKAISEGIEDEFGSNFIIIRKEVKSSPAEGLVEWLKLHPDMKIVVGITDGLALDAYQAVMAIDKNDPATFFVGGVDAVTDALMAIKSGGAYQATVTQSPRQMGIFTVRTLVAAIKGLPYEQVYHMHHVPVTLSEVDKFLNKDHQAMEVETTAEEALTKLDLSGIKIGLSILNMTNPFFVTLVDTAKEEAERLGIQLLVNDPKRVLGVLDVQSNIAGFLNEEDQLVLEGVCAQIAAAIESTRLRQEMEDRLRELNALQRLMSHEGWQAFQATREQAPPAYLFDQTSIQTTTLEELWLQHNHETTQKELTRTSIESNGHIIARPIAVRGEIIGALGVQNDSDSPLASEDQAFLDAVAEQVAEALERARLLEQTQKRAIEMETVAQVSAVASTILNTEKLLQEVADLTKGSFGLYHTHIYLLNEMGNTLDLAAGAGAVGRQMMAQGWSIPLEREHSIVVRAARDQQAIIANDVQQSPDFMPNPLLPDTRSEMAIPLIVGDSILGVLDVQADSINRFTDEDIQVQTTLAAQVAAALRNASLYQQTQAALADFKQSQELLRTTIDATPDWIFIKDRDHRYRLVNQGYADSLHTTPDALIGKNDLEIGFPEDIVKGNQELGIRGFWPDDLEVMDSGKPKFIEVEPAFIDGRPVFLSTIKVPLRDTSGNVWGVLGFVRDITQREQLLAEVENLYKATRQINEAHDLQGIVAAAAEVRPLSIISRVLLFTFERNLLDQIEAMTVAANWHSGQGTPPPPVGRRYGQNAFSIVQLMLSPEPLFFNDVQHDERIDAQLIAAAQEQNIRAMVVLPLQVGGHELGALCLQAEEVHEFSSREIQFYLSLAPQIAVAIDNQHLLAESHSALAEVERTQRRYTLQAWETYRDKLTTLSHEEVREGVNPLGNNLLTEINRTVAQSRRSRTNSQAQVILSDRSSEDLGQQTQTDSSLIVPLTVRGETIGVLGLQEIDKERIWSPEEISLIGAICEQLAQAAENIRLIDETQQRAALEKQVNEIGEKIQAAQSLEEALKIAVKEVGLSLQTTQTIVQLDVK